MLASVNVLWLIDALLIMNLLSGSIMLITGCVTDKSNVFIYENKMKTPLFKWMKIF